MIDLAHDDGFIFWVPLEISKAQNDQEAQNKKRLIQGIASTDKLDLQNEAVEQSGIDFSYFLRYGYYNNDHKPGFENKVGEPLECKVTKGGLWTHGFLYKNHKISDSIWELALALEASQSSRKLGFSVQGKVVRRSGNRILKCWVQDIAITTAPINTNTWLDVIKSLGAVPEEMWCRDPEEYVISPRLISPIAKSTCTLCQKDMQAKSCRALDESKMDLKKKADTDEDEEKALSSSSPVARVESLEGDVKDQLWGRSDKRVKKSISSPVNGNLDFTQCVDLLRDYRNLSRSDAEIVAETIFNMNGLSI